MALTDHLYQQELRERLLQKLIDDWENHFLRHGESFVNLTAIRNKNGFVEDVCDMVEAALAEQVGAVEAHTLTPSKDTFRRLLFEYDAENRWQSRTRLALCRYVGFASWEAFKEDVREQLKHEPVTVNINQIMVRPAWLPVRQVQHLLPSSIDPDLAKQPHKRFSRWMLITGLVGLFVLMGLSAWAWQWWQTRPFSVEQLACVRFRIERIEGKFLPQTLVLAYDARSLDVDSVVVDFSSIGREYNHQPGDLDRITKHETKGRFAYPFWKPADCVIRLIARDQVVATLRHTTQTDGWIGWTDDPVNGNTQALPQSQIQTDQRLHVPISARKGHPGDFFSHLAYQRPFDLDTDELDWQVRLKNPFADGGISCFEPSISAHWGGGPYQTLVMQTSRPGCGAGTFIRFGDTLLRNGEHNLSRLSTDFESWRTLRIVTKDRVAQFFVDGQLAFRHSYTQDLTPIQSLHIAFKGSGSVDWVRLANSRTGQVVYEENF